MNQYLEKLHRDITEPENEYLSVLKIITTKIMDCFYSKYGERDLLIRQYSFAIPNREAINKILEYSPIIEIGAGSGYWSYLIKKHGGKIIAFDNNQRNKNYIEYEKDIYWKREWFNVEYGNENKIKEYPNHTLFMCWIGYKSFYGYKALKLYKGKYFIYIGEFDGGCCGDDKFFKYLEKNFKEIKEIEIPQWYGIHDFLVIYKRR